MAKHKLDFCLKLYKIMLLMWFLQKATEENESVSKSVHVNVGML
jgi:hypothetical protein